MKHNYIVLIAFISFTLSQAQIVAIPDVNFKNALVNSLCVDTNDDGVFDADADTDNDGEIQVSEAESVISLDVSNNNISNISGMEAFINIEKLEMNTNQITTVVLTNNNALTELSAGTNLIDNLDISTVTGLKKLYVGNNALASLDISNNSQLTELCIFSNQLSSLNLPVSLNDLALFEFGFNPIDFADLDLFSNVTSLWCDSTEMTSLDLSQFTNLEVLVCLDNDLTFLDLRNGNNANISLFDATNNPVLECIFVDDANAAYLVDWDKDAASTFVNNETECQALSIEEAELVNTIKIYPNPARSFINIESQKQIETISIYDVSGKRVLHDVIQGIEMRKKLNISTLSSGLYLLKLKTNVGIQTSKIIIE